MAAMDGTGRPLNDDGFAALGSGGAAGGAAGGFGDVGDGFGDVGGGGGAAGGFAAFGSGAAAGGLGSAAAADSDEFDAFGMAGPANAPESDFGGFGAAASLEATKVSSKAAPANSAGDSSVSGSGFGDFGGEVPAAAFGHFGANVHGAAAPVAAFGDFAGASVSPARADAFGTAPALASSTATAASAAPDGDDFGDFGDAAAGASATQDDFGEFGDAATVVASAAPQPLSLTLGADSIRTIVARLLRPWLALAGSPAATGPLPSTTALNDLVGRYAESLGGGVTNRPRRRPRARAHGHASSEEDGWTGCDRSSAKVAFQAAVQADLDRLELAARSRYSRHPSLLERTARSAAGLTALSAAPSPSKADGVSAYPSLGDLVRRPLPSPAGG